MSKFKVGDKVIYKDFYEAEILEIIANSEGTYYKVSYLEPVIYMEGTKHYSRFARAEKSQLTLITDK